jgi:hypothetical protein
MGRLFMNEFLNSCSLGAHCSVARGNSCFYHNIDGKALPSLLSALAQRVCIHHELADDCALFPLARKHR